MVHTDRAGKPLVVKNVLGMENWFHKRSCAQCSDIRQKEKLQKSKMAKSITRKKSAK